MISPLSILRDSIRAVPAVKYALGVAGLLSVIAIVRLLNLDYRVAVIGTVMMLLVMTVLVVFAKLTSLAKPDFRLPALVFTWFSLLLVIAIAICLFFSVFFRIPVDLQHFLTGLFPEKYLPNTQPAERPDYGQNNSISNLPASSAMHGTIVVKSDPGDYIGAGKNISFTDADGKITSSASPGSVTIHFRGDDSWTLEFEAPEGELLRAGPYESAQRAPFHNPVKPGLEISGAGRGCNQLTGRFSIKTISYDTQGGLDRFIAEFEQHCEGAVAALTGTVDLSASSAK